MLAGAGTNLSSTFTRDIDGVTARTEPWDIGAYIKGSAGASWSITDVDLDDSIVDGQTGVIVAISGTVAGSWQEGMD